MMRIGDWILLSAVGVAAVPFLVLTIESLASLLPSRRRRFNHSRPRCAVLIPAHDEEGGIAATIQNVQRQLSADDRILVVADNCTDLTAAKARSAEAEVIERFDAEHRGKGYALNHGLNHLADDPPDVVVIVDADCELADGTLEALVQQAHSTRQPSQAIYRIGRGNETDPRRRLSAFAVQFKNQIRPLGLDRLGLPCLLMGAGMAFPWNVIRKANLASGNIVEDMKLGVDLALAGDAPRLCPSALVTSEAAPDQRSTIKQRTRWEHGHVQTLVTQAPRLFAAGVIRGRPSLIGLGLELAVPPLSLLVTVWTALLAISLIWWAGFNGKWVAAGVHLGVFVLWGMALFLAWAKHGRDILPFRTLLRAPMYVVWKLPIYAKLLVRREKKWIRTRRTKLQSGESA